MDMHLCLPVSEGQGSRESFPRCLFLKASHKIADKVGQGP